MHGKKRKLSQHGTGEQMTSTAWQFYYECSNGEHFLLPDCIFSDVEKATDWVLSCGFEFRKRNPFDLAFCMRTGIDLRFFTYEDEETKEWHRLTLSPAKVDEPLWAFDWMHKDD